MLRDARQSPIRRREVNSPETNPLDSLGTKGLQRVETELDQPVALACPVHGSRCSLNLLSGDERLVAVPDFGAA